MTTRTERLEHVRLHIDRMLQEWRHKTGKDKAGLVDDPRTQKAISLLADVLGNGNDAGDRIGDETFIDEEDAS